METQSVALAPDLRHRADGWTPDIQHAFVEALARTGCVRLAAEAVDRSRASAYRLRARPDAHAFRAAWDAALGLAYERLRDMAIDRLQNGLEHRVYDPEGNLVARRVVHSDRLLMFLLDHHKPAVAPIAQNPGDAFGDALVALDRAPAGAGIARPAERNGYRTDLTDDELVEEVRQGRINFVEAGEAVPALEDRLCALWNDPAFRPKTAGGW